MQVSGGTGLRWRAGPWQELGGHPDPPGTTLPGERAGEPSELRPGAAGPGWGVRTRGSGQLPPRAPGPSSCPEHPSLGTALTSWDTGLPLLWRNDSRLSWPPFPGCSSLQRETTTSLGRSWKRGPTEELHPSRGTGSGGRPTHRARATLACPVGKDTHTPNVEECWSSPEKCRGQNTAWPCTSHDGAAGNGPEPVPAADGWAGGRCGWLRTPTLRRLSCSRLSGAMVTAL